MQKKSSIIHKSSFISLGPGVIPVLTEYVSNLPEEQYVIISRKYYLSITYNTVDFFDVNMALLEENGYTSPEKGIDLVLEGLLLYRLPEWGAGKWYCIQSLKH